MKHRLIALVPLAFLPALCPTTPQSSEHLPWTLAEASDWRTNAAWYDGKAEKCVYEATRTIYGVPRAYDAIAYTNKQRMDPRTTTKASRSEGIEVFKHHWSERVPTENYDYDFSTATFTRTDDLAPYKLTVATQEDCGASFKQIVADGRDYAWLESVYLPGTGLRKGKLRNSKLLFADALPLILRDYVAAGPARPGQVELTLLPSQKSTRSVPFAPTKATSRYAGEETLELPIGSVKAHRVDIVGQSVGRASYWFAADSSAPWLHALVRFEGADGTNYSLKSIERTAYWARN